MKLKFGLLAGHTAMAALATIIMFGTPAKATDYAYMATGSYSPPTPPFEFGVVDLTTGVFVSCGNTTDGTTQVELAGLGVGGDQNLYGGEFEGSTFYSVNITNGSLKNVGTSTISFFLQGSTHTNQSDVLYAVGTDSNLYAIDYQTGAASLKGPLGIIVDENHTWGMSTNAKNLYMTENSTIYIINTSTGKAHKVGSGGNTAFGSEVAERGILYAGSFTPTASIYTIDQKTGKSTFQANLSGQNNTLPVGLAPIKEQSISPPNICKPHQIP